MGLAAARLWIHTVVVIGLMPVADSLGFNDKAFSGGVVVILRVVGAGEAVVRLSLESREGTPILKTGVIPLKLLQSEGELLL